MNKHKDRESGRVDTIVIRRPTLLPRCKHGKPLSDWAGDWLQPSCGCNFDNTSDQNQRDMAFLKLKLGV